VSPLLSCTAGTRLACTKVWTAKRRVRGARDHRRLPACATLHRNGRRQADSGIEEESGFLPHLKPFRDAGRLVAELKARESKPDPDIIHAALKRARPRER
jgi:hypothetical protein